MLSGMRLASPVLIVLAACGPKTSADDGVDASGGATADTGSTDTGATPTTADEAGVPSCDVYDPAPDIGPAVTVTVRHEGTSPVFFIPHGCGGAITLAITNGSEKGMPYLLDGECFPNTCDGFVGAADCSVGCNDCAPPTAGRIDPGALAETAWPGRVLAALQLDPQCAPAEGCPATCVRPDQAPPDTYELALTVFRTCTGTCECDGPGPGVCGLWTGDEQVADPITFTAIIDYPAQTNAEITITD